MTLTRETRNLRDAEYDFRQAADDYKTVRAAGIAGEFSVTECMKREGVAASAMLAAALRVKAALLEMPARQQTREPQALELALAWEEEFIDGAPLIEVGEDDPRRLADVPGCFTIDRKEFLRMVDEKRGNLEYSISTGLVSTP